MRVASLVGAVSAAVLAAAAEAQPSPANPPATPTASGPPAPLYLRGPSWAEKPSKAEFMAAWPADAAKAGLPGVASIRCGADSAGRLHDCAMLQEDPPGHGFGAALIALAPRYRLDLAKTGPVDQVAFALSWPVPDQASSWDHRPTAEDAQAVLPAGAKGSALLGCTVTPTGAVEHCATLAETVAGAGDAAMRLAPRITMTPALYQGRAVASAVQIPVNITPPPFVRVAFQCHVAAGPRLERCQIVDGGGLAAETWPHAAALIEAAPLCGPQPDLVVGQDVKSTVTLPSPLPSEALHLIVQPDWLERPTAEALMKYYPESDAARATGGTAVINCLLTKAGRVSSCTVESETPPGLGFGQAAVKAATEFRFKPMLKDCQPVDGGKIRIPLTFPAAD